MPFPKILWYADTLEKKIHTTGKYWNSLSWILCIKKSILRCQFQNKRNLHYNMIYFRKKAMLWTWIFILFYNILEVVIICVNTCDVGTRNLTKPVGDSWSSFWVTYNWFCGVGFSSLGSWWFLNHFEFYLRSRATMGCLIFIFVAFLLGTAHPTSVVGKKN